MQNGNWADEKKFGLKNKKYKGKRGSFKEKDKCSTTSEDLKSHRVLGSYTHYIIIPAFMH